MNLLANPIYRRKRQSEKERKEDRQKFTARYTHIFMIMKLRSHIPVGSYIYICVCVCVCIYICIDILKIWLGFKIVDEPEKIEVKQ